jgi:DNA-binding protein H-NS
MAKTRSPENMSYAELNKLGAQVDRLMAAKRNATRAELRDKIAELAKAEGINLEDVLGGRGGGGRGKGSVPAKYRDPANPQNVWTGRGRMPRWMVAAMKGGKTKKEDFLI